VSVRFDIYDTSICFVNSHLAASQENVQRRNQDFHDICRRTTFDNSDNSSTLTVFDHE